MSETPENTPKLEKVELLPSFDPEHAQEAFLAYKAQTDQIFANVMEALDDGGKQTLTDLRTRAYGEGQTKTNALLMAVVTAYCQAIGRGTEAVYAAAQSGGDVSAITEQLNVLVGECTEIQNQIMQDMLNASSTHP